VDVQGLGSEKTLKQLGEAFELHPLLLEDVVNVPQRPKVKDYNEQLLIIAQMVLPKSNEEGFDSEQIGFVIGKKYLLTFQQEPKHDCFDRVRDRLRTNRGRIRQSGTDYLAYTLLDALIDSFFPGIGKLRRAHRNFRR
jgi:magnesium transporter